MTPRSHDVVALFATLAVACGGLSNAGSGEGGGGGGTAGHGSGGTSGAGAGGSQGGSGGTEGVGGTVDGGGRFDGGGGADGGGPMDATVTLDVILPPLDAALASLDAAPPGLAGFAFIVNDVVQHPMACKGTNWEFAPYPATGPGGCSDSCTGAGGWGPIGMGSCPGIESVILVNTGALDMPYIASPCWDVLDHTAYAPGGYPGGVFLAGVLAPGAYVDITKFYNSGITALVGSAEPFSSPDSSYASDEGQIPWPLGVKGSGGATTMYVAEIEVRTACQAVTSVW